MTLFEGCKKTNLFVDLKICKQNIRAVDSGCMREALAKVKLKFMQAINALNVENEKERERECTECSFAECTLQLII